MLTSIKVLCVSLSFSGSCNQTDTYIYVGIHYISGGMAQHQCLKKIFLIRC